MSKREIIESYVRGDVDRRGFIRSLTALGVSATAAASYALSLSPVSAAAGTSSRTGFVVRAQDAADDEYGTAFTFESDEEALTTLAEGLTATVDTITSAISAFSAEEFVAAGFPADTAEILGAIAENLQTRLDSLVALGIISAPTPSTGTAAAPATPQEALEAVANALQSLVELLGAVGPALEDGEARQTVSNIGLATAKDAGVAEYLAGTYESTPFVEPSLG